MPKLTPNNSRSAQMMTRAAGKGMLTAEDDQPVQSGEAQNPTSAAASTPEGPRFDSLVSYPAEAPEETVSRSPPTRSIASLI